MTTTDNGTPNAGNTVRGAAVAIRENSAAGLIQQYSSSFEQVLPTHIKPATWVRLAQGALKRGKRVQGGKFELEVAAMNNPHAFLAALLDSARLGLEPGTEQYYLTPRKVGGRLEILGIVGYQGYIELMYRAGAISSVIAEVVYTNDVFRFQPGRDQVPHHEIDWDSEDRGELRLTYAYAQMKDGAYSRVVVLNRADIKRIKESSAAARSEYSPWKTNEAAMWLKSSIRQLQKWVPTSAEFRREQMRAAVVAENERQVIAPTVEHIGAVDDDGVILDGELVDDETVDDPSADERAADETWLAGGSQGGDQ